MQNSADIPEAILAIAAQRGSEKSTCPSEIARMLYPDEWRRHMKEIVDAAIVLQNEGKVLITQNGNPVGTGRIKGPIRIRII